MLDSYFSNNKYFITKHHLDSYDRFVNDTIDKIIKSMNPFSIPKYDQNNNLKHEINVEIVRTFYSKQELLPNECRIRNRSYISELRADILITIVDASSAEPFTRELKDIFMCYVPIMLHSSLCILRNKSDGELQEYGECYLDQGGYFIIDGKEKVIVAQERNVNNKLFVNLARDQEKFKYQAFMRCTSETDSVFPKTLWLYIKYNNEIVVKVPHINTEVPLFILFRAMGIESDLAILQNIFPNWSDISDNVKDFIRYSIVGGSSIYGQTEALEYLAPYTDFKTVENVMHIFFEDFMPNSPENLIDKAKFLGEIARHLVDVGIGAKQESDRDNYITKRVGISGFLLGDIFKDFYNNFRVETMKKIDNKYEFGTNMDNIKNIINEGNKKEIFSASEKFQWGLLKSLKGNWGLSNDSTKQGIVQDLNRISYMGFISHMRRVNAPMDTSIKIRSPHQLETSQYGMMCPCESPDGASIGLLKNMAVLCHISAGVPAQIILDALKIAKFKLDFVEDIVVCDMLKGTKLQINNIWIANVDDPVNITKYLRLLRRNGLINIYVSVSWNVFENTINVLTDSGRCCRPLKLAKSKFNDPKAKWKELLIGKSNLRHVDDENHSTFIDPFKLYKTNNLKEVLSKLKENQGGLEYIDVEETNCSLIAMDTTQIKKETTHIEIHPSTVFSVYTSTIPLPNHNQAPRNIFSGAQGKQAIGVYATNFNNRIDTMSYLLYYPQKPIVSTRYSNYLGANQLPNGENLIVAIATYQGYNQEDSIILNRRSLENGMFNITYFKSFVSSEVIEKDSKTKTEKFIFFANPNVLKATKNVKLTKWADYSKIDENGIPKLESYIDEGDCITGMCIKNIDYVEEGDPTKDIYIQKTEVESYQSKCKIADKISVGFVDKLALFENKNGEKELKIRLRKTRTPELGDKLASRHGQKGVIGMILPPESMPFTKDGLVPDIIINPHAFPTRMTVGHLIECILAKSGCASGFYADGTAFENQDYDKTSEVLDKYGLNLQGDEIMYNGITGEQMKCEVFIGPTYYFRLKHMVSDKINSRDKGQVVGMTQQPTKGRSNGGGLRIGEMETNVLISHGISAFTKDSLVNRSDKYSINVSKRTGHMIPVNEAKKIVSEPYNKFEVPYASKQLILELESMSIGTRLTTEDIEEENSYGSGLESSDEEDLHIDDAEMRVLNTYLNV